MHGSSHNQCTDINFVLGATIAVRQAFKVKEEVNDSEHTVQGEAV